MTRGRARPSNPDSCATYACVTGHELSASPIKRWRVRSNFLASAEERIRLRPRFSVFPPKVRAASRIPVYGGLMDGVQPSPLAASTNCTPRVHRRDIILPNRLAHQLLIGEREMFARRRWCGHCGFVALAGTKLWAKTSQTKTNGCQCKLLPEA